MGATIVAISAGKGGVGKTTTAWGLASFLSQQYPTLCWDQDPQASLTSAVAGEVELTAFDVLVHKKPLDEAIRPALPEYGGNLFVVAASPLLSGLETALASDLDRQHVLADALSGLYGFRYVVIDCPSAQNLLTTSALVAADVVLSPVACAPASFETLDQFEETIKVVRRRLNPRLQWCLAATQFDSRQLLDRQVLDTLRERFTDRLIEPPIRRRISLAEDMAAQRPCQSQDYELLTSNLLERITRDCR